MRKTALRLPEPVWRALKIRAIDEDSTLQQVIVDAVTAHLKTPKAKPAKKASTSA